MLSYGMSAHASRCCAKFSTTRMRHGRCPLLLPHATSMEPQRSPVLSEAVSASRRNTSSSRRGLQTYSLCYGRQPVCSDAEAEWTGDIDAVEFELHDGRM